MKSFQTILLFSGLSLACLYGCHKEISSGGGKTVTPPHTLTLSASTVKKGQALVASLPAGLTANSASWTVRPSTGTLVHSNGQSATITFSDAGTYTVTAVYLVDSVSGVQDSATSPIIVSDSTYTQPSDTLTIASEKFILTAQPVADTSAAVDTGIVFMIQTVDNYPCNASVPLTQSAYPFGDTLTLSTLSLNLGNACTGAGVPAVGYFTIENIPVGSTRTVSVNLPFGEGDFIFNITASSTAYTFTPIPGSTSLISLSSLTLQK